MVVTPSAGDLLRYWRRRRRLRQQDLADRAEIAMKLLSQIETGQAAASRELVLRLTERLAVPLRDRNVILTAAGYAPMFHERNIDHAELAAVRQGLCQALTAHEPNPMMVIDRHWRLVLANDALHRLVAGADPLLLHPPINVLRLWLHPAGLAPRIANLRDWRDQVQDRLRHQIEASGDSRLTDLLEEIQDYPLPRGATPFRPHKAFEAVAVPFRLVTIDGTLSFFVTSTRFSAALDVTLDELTIETFFPLDQETVTILAQMAEHPMPRSWSEVRRAMAEPDRKVLVDEDLR
jgi:transcriptional regulator with XRE-family HTH domain